MQNQNQLKSIEISRLPEYSEQEVFDWVAFQILRQGRQSQYNLSCYYRHPHGLKCAAGFCMSDETYEALGQPEGKGIAAVLANLHFEVELSDSRLETLLRALQTIHDSRSVRHWKRALTELARIRKLNDKILDTI